MLSRDPLDQLIYHPVIRHSLYEHFVRGVCGVVLPDHVY